MRTNLATLAVAAAVAYLLGRPSHRHADDAYDDDYDVDSDSHGSLGRTLVGLAALAAGGMYLANTLRPGRRSDGMSVVEASIDLDVPVRTAYNQWTQFEQFPQFMASVQEVQQLDDTHLHWRAVVAGKTKEWDAEITEQIPDQRIAWRSTSGPQNVGAVTFDKTGENRSSVRLEMAYRPESTGERIGDALGGVKLTAKGNLQRFKQLVERRGTETGAWREEVAPQH